MDCPGRSSTGLKHSGDKRSRIGDGAAVAWIAEGTLEHPLGSRQGQRVPGPAQAANNHGLV